MSTTSATQLAYGKHDESPPLKHGSPGPVSPKRPITSPSAIASSGVPTSMEKRHADGSQSIYKHLTRVDVALGELLPRGTQVGLSGSNGYSTGPHAHVMRQQDCADSLRCESVPLVFADVDGDGEPETDEYVTSQNCR